VASRAASAGHATPIAAPQGIHGGKDVNAVAATTIRPGELASGHRQATYRELFAIREFRLLFAAKTQSDFGDCLARVALTFLVYTRSHSPVLSAAAYAVTYFPWVLGPLLAVVADRSPRRTVLVTCDLARAALYGSLAVPVLPAPAMIAIALLAGFFSVPFEASRAALMPDVLADDRYLLASGLTAATNQVSRLAGFALGGVIVAAADPVGAIVIDAATFLISAALIRSGVRHRPGPVAPGADAPRTGLRAVAADTRSGIGYVFSQPTLRIYLALMWSSCLFVYSYQGQVATLVQDLHGGARLGGVLLAAAPTGLAIGAIVLTRLIPPARRLDLVLPLAFVACGVQTLLWTRPGSLSVAAVFFVVGLTGVYSSILNPLFVKAADPAFRGRAMGVAVAGINLAQGAAVLIAAVGAHCLGTVNALGWCGLCGACVPVLILPRWPRRPRQRRRHPAGRGPGLSSGCRADRE
jgi:hypothetical protein